MLTEAFGDPSPAPSLPPTTTVSSTSAVTISTTSTSSCTAAAATPSVTTAAVPAASTVTTPVPERRRSARKNPNDGGQIQEEEEEEEEEEEMKVEPPETPTHTGPLSSEDAMEINQLYSAIITAKDGERDISEVFQRLPPRSVSIKSASIQIPLFFPPPSFLSIYVCMGKVFKQIFSFIYFTVIQTLNIAKFYITWL